jgi:hypothetical protein
LDRNDVWELDDSELSHGVTGKLEQEWNKSMELYKSQQRAENAVQFKNTKDNQQINMVIFVVFQL